MILLGAAPLVATTALQVELPIRGMGARRMLRAVDGVDLTVRRGEVLGLVGESGCGKSTTARALMRLVRPSAGRVVFDGIDITALSQQQLRPLRRRMQMIFQHPGSALNPRTTIRRSIAEPLDSVRVAPRERETRVDEALARVGLDAAFGPRYPHELSGGQLQRVAIARALIGSAEFVVADEPLSALDLSVQAQVVTLLKDLQRETGISLLFITHDLAMAEFASDRITVMYLGKIVETAPARQFSKRARHPYSAGLLNSALRLDPLGERARPRPLMTGEIPSALRPPAGCRFHPRCALASDHCRNVAPTLRKIADEHEIACWNV